MSLKENVLRCVIADDVRVSRVLLQAWIEDCGYVCETRSNGVDAWEAIMKSKPNLVVTDIEMRGASGLDLLFSMRSHTSKVVRAIPVIVVSSLIDSEIGQFVHDAGGTVFLPKPLEKDSMQRVIKNVHNLASETSDRELSDDNQSLDGSVRVSPTLRRIVRDLQVHGPKFK